MSSSFENVENRLIIKYNYLKGMKASETRELLIKKYGDKALSKTAIYRWYKEFKTGRRTTINNIRTGRPANVTTLENIQAIHELLMEDRRIHVRIAADAAKVSMGSTIRILNDQLNVRKMVDTWVPRSLSSEQQMERLRMSTLCLQLMQRNLEEFVKYYITVDRSWIYYRTKGTEKANIMVTIFWDASGIIFIDFMDQDEKMTAKYYGALLKRLNDELVQKRTQLMKQKLYFHHYEPDRVRDSNETAEIFSDFDYEELPQPPCSPDLSPSDYFLYPNLKKWLLVKKFASRDEFKRETYMYFKELAASFYAEGIRNLEHRLKKCIELEGAYLGN